MVRHEKVSVSYLAECFVADFQAGKLVWKQRPIEHFVDARSMRIWNTRYSGKQAGNIYKKNEGYWCYQVGIRKVSYLLHQVLWALHNGRWPKGLIEHLDGNPFNNRIDNLKESNQSSNNKFLSKNRRNKSGVNGVFWDNRRGRWTLNKFESSDSRPYLNSTNDFFEAVCARKSYELKHGCHERHGM